jgi:hypothetical protein
MCIQNTAPVSFTFPWQVDNSIGRIGVCAGQCLQKTYHPVM